MMSIALTITSIVERAARHKALRHVNRAIIAVLVLASLFALRETVGLLTGGGGKDVSKPAETSGEDSGKRALMPLTYYAPVVSNNIFGIEGQSLSTITREQAQAASAPVQTAPAVNIKLLGTVAWSDASGYAFVIESGQEQKMYKRGSLIPGAGKLAEVHPDMVVMDYNGNVYEVPLEKFMDDKSAPQVRHAPDRAQRPTGGRDFSQFARRTGENEFVVSKRAIDESIQNPQNVLTDARLLPNIESGQQRGFRVSEIKPGGLYQTLGLQNGDILLAVNNFKLSSPESALQAFATLQGASAIELELERGGKKISLKYNIR